MKKIILYCFFFLVAHKVNAQNTFDVFTYKEPKNYKKQVGNGFISFIKYNKAKTAFCNIGMYAAVTNNGTLQEVFIKDWNNLIVKTYNPTLTPVPEQAQDINGWQVIQGYAPYTAQGTQRAAMLYTFTKKEMAAAIVIATNSKEFEADITALINSIKFKDVPTKVITPQTTSATASKTNSKFGGGITGIWLSYTNNYPFSTDMIWKHRVFFNDGTFLETTPYNGLANFKRDANIEVGTYNLNGSNGSVKMPAWTSATAIKLEAANKLKIGTEIFYKSDDVNGKTFTGSYTSYTSSFMNELGSRPVGDRPLIHFNSNGSFTDEGIFKHFITGFANEDDSPGKGTYSITEYTITLKYTDGRTKTKTLCTPFGSKLGEKSLGLGNTILNKYK